MGHKRKTANRGVAIARNAERVRKLADETGDNFKDLKAKVEHQSKVLQALGERLDSLEQFAAESQAVQLYLHQQVRPWWRKAGQWAATGWGRFKIKERPGTTGGVNITEAVDDGTVELEVDDG